MTWGRFKARGYECILKNPSSDAMWYPSTTVHLNPTLHKLDAFFYHTIPAYLFDLMSRLAGKRPKMVGSFVSIGRLDPLSLNSAQNHFSNEFSRSLCKCGGYVNIGFRQSHRCAAWRMFFSTFGNLPELCGAKKLETLSSLAF